jgi:REP element-mobilizing transposase RayT
MNQCPDKSKPYLQRCLITRYLSHKKRGDRREDVFFIDEGRVVYLRWSKEYCKQHKVEILAYYLVKSHIHIIALPKNKVRLQLVFKPLHTRFSQRFNRQRGWKGHVWQGRYFSSALNENYLWPPFYTLKGIRLGQKRSRK